MNNRRLSVGIDIGKTGNYFAFKVDGKEVHKRTKLKNDFYGNVKCKNIIDKMCEKYSLSYDDCIIGLESTGPYWKNAKYYFEKCGFKVVCTLHEVVDAIKKIEKIKGKDDSIDSYAIATVVEMGKYEKITEQTVKLESIKRLARYTEELLKEQVRIKNKIRSWIAEFNQPFEKYFREINNVTAKALLKLYPSPLDVVGKDYYLVIEHLKEQTKIPDKKGVKLYLEECNEIKKFILHPSEINRLEIERYVDRLERVEEEVEVMKLRLEELAAETFEEWSTLSSIKSIPKTQLIIVLAEIGDIRRFKSPRHLLSYAGLKLCKKNESGDRGSQSKISKKGNVRIRKNTFLIVRTLIIHNRTFRHLYCRYKSYKRKYTNSDKAMLIGVACKFLRIIFGVMKNKTTFNSKEVLKGCNLLECDIKKYVSEFETEQVIKIDFDELSNIYGIQKEEIERLIKM
ncbi:IS110 family RNA-guided transposase [Clostridium culturomicium]|uniref:IS110 family transposase n=1 Tax=Clostridium culturomicium TaxID=1499683 RepID=UPI003857F01B